MEEGNNIDAFSSIVLARHGKEIMSQHYDTNFQANAAELAVSKNSELWGLGPTDTQTKREQYKEALRRAAQAIGPRFGPLRNHLIVCEGLLTSYRRRHAVVQFKKLHLARVLPAVDPVPICGEHGVFLPDPKMLNGRPTIFSDDAMNFVCSCCHTAAIMRLVGEDENLIDDQPIVGFVECSKQMCANEHCNCDFNKNVMVAGYVFKPSRTPSESEMKKRKL